MQVYRANLDFLTRRRDNRAGFWVHKGFSEGAENTSVLPREEEVQEKAKYSRSEMQQLLDGFFSVCSWTKVSYLWRPNLRGEGDNHLIDLAVAGNARWIVTQNIKDFGSGELKFSFKPITPEKLIEVEYGNNHL